VPQVDAGVPDPRTPAAPDGGSGGLSVKCK